MKNKIFALIDCNAFYVSCERVFNPKLNNRPVVALSNIEFMETLSKNEKFAKLTGG